MTWQLPNHHNASQGRSYKVAPAFLDGKQQTKCFLVNGSVDAQNVLPDLKKSSFMVCSQAFFFRSFKNHCYLLISSQDSILGISLLKIISQLTSVSL